MKVKILCLFTLMFIINSFAQNAGQQLSQLLSRFQSMQANFTQTSYDNSGRQLQKSTGTMALVRPGKFRWNIVTPSQQIIIADGKNIWVYDADLQQASKQVMDASQNTNPASLLSGSITDLQQRFVISPLDKKDGAQWFELKPIAKEDMFQWIQLRFQNGALTEMILSDNLGQQSIVDFSQVKTNISLDSSLFQFKPPKGTDVFSQ